MRYRRLGAAGVKVSEIGLGTWLTYGRGVDDSVAAACIRRAFELGINFFDTADVYALGASEAACGPVFAELRRQDLVLATKCYFPMSDNVNDRGLSRKHIFESVENSLRRLRTPYIDLYQCHRYDADVTIGEVCRAMDDLIRQGKILYWGVSEWSADQIRSAFECCRSGGMSPPASNQPEYSIAARRVETNGVQDNCAELGLGMVVWSPLKQGVLTGKYSGGKVPAQSRAASDTMNAFLRSVDRELADRVDRLRPIAQRRNCSLAQLALAWVLGRRAVSSAIIGASAPAQIDENVAALEVALDAADLRTIDGLFPAAENP